MSDRTGTHLAALYRADKIISWMADYIGRMAPPSGGLADLNEHFVYMEKLRGPRKRVRTAPPLDQPTYNPVLRKMIP